MEEIGKRRKIILFDGVCNFCNGFVKFVIQREKCDTFYFAALQSTPAAELLKRYDLPAENMASVVLIDEKKGKVYTESSAVLRILRNLKGLYPLLFLFIIFPKFLRDSVYRYIARNRYRWFGKRESCMIPTADLKKKFL